jgi:hypothetical protein
MSLRKKRILKLWTEHNYLNKEIVIGNLWTGVSIHQLIHHLSKSVLRQMVTRSLVTSS